MSLAIKSFYEFGSFTLDPEERVLLHNGKPVSLTPKVFDTLLLLVRNQGRVVSKEEIFGTVWRNSFVEESNLTFNIRKLRQVLGDEKKAPTYVETIPRRGYRFKAQVKEVLQESQFAPVTEIRLSSPTFEREVNETPEKSANYSLNFTSEAEVLNSLQTISPQTIPTSNILDSSLPRYSKYLLLAACLFLLVLSGGFVAWRYNAQKDISNVTYERLSSDNTSCAVISADGRYLAYVSGRTKGQQSLWLRQLETNTNLQIIPPEDSFYGGLVFSRDAQQLYFTRFKDKEPGSIYRISILGGVATELIKEPQGQFSISPDESQIAFTRYYKVENRLEHALFVADINGKNERKLITRRQPDGLWSPAWSPDGQSIVCLAGNSHTSEPSEQIIEVSSSDGTENILHKSDWFHIRQVKPLSNGSGLLLVAKPTNSNSNCHFYSFSDKTKEIFQITYDPACYASFSMTDDAKKIVLTQTVLTSNVWITFDGSEDNAKQITSGFGNVDWMNEGKIVFTSGMNGNSDISAMNPDGSEIKQLSFNNDYSGNPAVTADNRYIVFVTNRKGKNHIWRMDSNGNDQVQLTNGFGEQSPSVSPDGKWVFYNSVDHNNIWKVSIEGGEAVKVTDETCSRPEVSPDGKMIACYQRSADLKLQLSILPIDGGEPLKKFEFVSEKLPLVNLRWTPNSAAVDYAACIVGVCNIWRQSLDGKKAQQITRFKTESIYGFDWSPDGKQLAVTRGHWEDNIVLLRGLR